MYKNIGKLSGKVPYVEEEMQVGISAELYQLIYICGQYACVTPLVVCAKASVCVVSCLVWQKLCGVWVSFALHHLTWLYLTAHPSKTLLFCLIEKWLWKIPSHLSWIYMKMKITSSSLVYSLMNNSSGCTQLFFFIIIIINYVCIAGKDRKAVTAASWEMLNVKNLVRPRCAIWELEDRQW